MNSVGSVAAKFHAECVKRKRKLAADDDYAITFGFLAIVAGQEFGAFISPAQRLARCDADAEAEQDAKPADAQHQPKEAGGE